MDVWYNYDEHVPGLAPHSRPAENGLAQQQMPHFYRYMQQGDASMNAGAHAWAVPGAGHDLMPSHGPGPDDDCLELAHSFHREHSDGAAESLPTRYSQHEDVSHSSGRFSDFGEIPVRGAVHGPAQLSWEVVPSGLQQPSPSPTAPPFLPTIMERTASRRSVGASSASSHQYSHASGHGTSHQFSHHASNSPALPASSASAHSLHVASFQNGMQQPGPPPYGNGMPPSGRWSFTGSDVSCSAAPKLAHNSAPCRQASDHMSSGPPGYMLGHGAQQKHQGDSRGGQVSDMARCVSLQPASPEARLHATDKRIKAALSTLSGRD